MARPGALLRWAEQPPSSRGLGRHPFKVEITGSNPVGGTNSVRAESVGTRQAALLRLRLWCRRLTDDPPFHSRLVVFLLRASEPGWKACGRSDAVRVGVPSWLVATDNGEVAAPTAVGQDVEPLQDHSLALLCNQVSGCFRPLYRASRRYRRQVPNAMHPPADRFPVDLG